MRTIGIVHNPLAEHTGIFAGHIERWLRARGITIWVGTSQEGRHAPQTISRCELLIALGGDGTILRTARLAIPFQVPILGVAMGHLSFMAEVTTDEIFPGLELLLSGAGWYDERALADATLTRDGALILEEQALNEVLITRGELARVVAVKVAVNDALMTTYTADGVIVATATGSTAYALAAGGPVLDPRAQSLVLVPVAAHLANIPSLVLDRETRLTLRLQSRHPAYLNFDGQTTYPLQEGDEVRVWRSDVSCRFARVHPPSHFYETLTRRLNRDHLIG